MKFLATICMISFILVHFVHSAITCVKDGTCKSPQFMNEFFRKHIDSQEYQEGLPLINFIDCTSDGTGCNTVNKIVDTKFEKQPNCILIDFTPSSINTLSSFDSMVESKFNGIQVAEFCATLDSTTVAVINVEEIDDVLIGFRRLFKIFFSKDTNLGLLIKSDNTVPLDLQKEISNKILNFFIENEIFLSENKKLNCIFINTESVDKRDFSEFIKSTSPRDINSIGDLISSTWSELSTKGTQNRLAQNEKQALLSIESAYTSGLAYLEDYISDWQSRVGSGRLIANFGKRVESLMVLIQKQFRERTLASNLVKERAEKARLLSDTLQISITNLYRQQISILQSKVIGRFRKSIRNQMMKADSVSTDQEKQLLRNSLFEFKNKADELEVPIFGLNIESTQSEFSNSLQTLLKEFPDSAIAKLDSLKKIEKKTRKPAKKPKNRAINLAFSIVGMLRPNGYGNLQGFVNYATGLAGFPIDFLFGFHNDGESPEVLGEDREFPILRLQPKVNFDIEL